jgi:site-specific recombinase XerD
MFRRMTRERFLSDAELEAFMAAVRGRRHKHQPRDHALFALLANTGIRPSEAMALTIANVHVHARDPWIRLHRPHKQHAAEPTNELGINRKVASVLGKHLDMLTDDRQQKLFPFTKRQSERLFKRYCLLAGIGQTYRLYSLRHTVGMRLWRHTKDLRLMQAIMGHVRLQATASYVHVSPERMRQAHAQIGTVG